jgi:hypothetical protein
VSAPAPEEWLIELASETARELARRANAGRLASVNERDHLQPSCSSAALTVAKRRLPGSTVSTSFRFQSSLWPRLGTVDIALLRGVEPPSALELKCGAGRDALGPCAWDALKLALGIQSRVLSAGYLLAATTTADWGSGHRGTELFGTDEFEALDLRERYVDWWRQWERLGDPLPLEVPRRFTTRAICRAPFAVAGTGWEVQVASVAVPDGERIAWLSTGPA